MQPALNLTAPNDLESGQADQDIDLLLSRSPALHSSGRQMRLPLQASSESPPPFRIP